MTGRERMKKALRREIPDHVPFNPQLTYPHAIHLFCEDYIEGIIRSIEDPLYRMEMEYRATIHYGSDALRIFLPGPEQRVEKRGDNYYVYPQEGGPSRGRLDFETGNIVHEGPPEISKKEDLERLTIPSPEEYLHHPLFYLVEEAVKKAGKDLLCIGAVPGMTMNFIMAKRGGMQGLMDLVEHPDLVHHLFSIGTQRAINTALALADAGIDCIYLGDASSSCSLISPEQFERFCLPYYSRFVEEIRSTGMLTYLHICGNANPILEMMADTGVDCIEPLDPLGGVDVGEAKKRVGHRVALMGGVNTMVLARGGVMDVKRESIQAIEKGWEGGGYILAAGDMIPNKAPEENIHTMASVAKQYRYY